VNKSRFGPTTPTAKAGWTDVTEDPRIIRMTPANSNIIFGFIIHSPLGWKEKPLGCREAKATVDILVKQARICL
jgi:hypothetical protein